jgi:hypothetical protein
MYRNKTIPIGVLNLAMHAPHSEERYSELIEALFATKHSVTTRGASKMMIGRLYSGSGVTDDSDLVSGEIYTFFNLDARLPWLNTDRSEEALEDEVKEVFIPENLKPHFSKFAFVFILSTHRMYIQLRSGRRSLGIQAAATGIARLLAMPDLEDYAPVDVTVEPSKDVVDRIFEMPFLRKLHIELLRPNPDDGHRDERRLLARLESASASKMSEDWVSERESSLRPDEEIKTLARIAASNGFVEASGKDLNNAPTSISTRESPLIEKVLFNPRESSLIAFMIEQARRMNSLFWRENGQE